MPACIFAFQQLVENPLGSNPKNQSAPCSSQGDLVVSQCFSQWRGLQCRSPNPYKPLRNPSFRLFSMFHQLDSAFLGSYNTPTPTFGAANPNFWEALTPKPYISPNFGKPPFGAKQVEVPVPAPTVSARSRPFSAFGSTPSQPKADGLMLRV